MFGDACGDGEDVGVENDVAGVEADAVHQQVIGADTYAHLAVLVHGLESRKLLLHVYLNSFDIFHFYHGSH